MKRRIDESVGMAASWPKAASVSPATSRGAASASRATSPAARSRSSSRCAPTAPTHAADTTDRRPHPPRRPHPHLLPHPPRARTAPRAAPTPADPPVPPDAAWRADVAAADALPIPDYDELSASQVVERLDGLDRESLEAIRRYETEHRGRNTILGKIAQLN